jgi:hypothetical protein
LTATNDDGVRDHEAPAENPKGWGTLNPISRRTELKHNLPVLSDAIKQTILENAASREDFIDHDKVHSKGFFGCLCELSFWTGSPCIQQHLTKGADNKTINMPGNSHWSWHIDVAPRGYVCPRAYERQLAAPFEKAEGCPILLFDEPPSKEWALAQISTDPVGTVAGHVLQNKYQRPCPKCDGGEVDVTQRLRTNQAARFEFRGFFGDRFRAPVLPVQYELPGTMRPRHGMLRNGGWYHRVELSQFDGVATKEL